MIEATSVYDWLTKAPWQLWPILTGWALSTSFTQTVKKSIGKDVLYLFGCRLTTENMTRLARCTGFWSGWLATAGLWWLSSPDTVQRAYGVVVGMVVGVASLWVYQGFVFVVGLWKPELRQWMSGDIASAEGREEG